MALTVEESFQMFKSFIRGAVESANDEQKEKMKLLEQQFFEARNESLCSVPEVVEELEDKVEKLSFILEHKRHVIREMVLAAGKKKLEHMKVAEASIVKEAELLKENTELIERFDTMIGIGASLETLVSDGDVPLPATHYLKKIKELFETMGPTEQQSQELQDLIKSVVSANVAAVRKAQKEIDDQWQYYNI